MSTTRRADLATIVCALDGHVTPAAEVAELAGTAAGLGIDLDVAWRLSRCVRCDAWIAAPRPADPPRRRLPPLDELDLPRRGRALRNAVVLRLIAVERGFHSVLFALVAAAAIALRVELAAVQSWVRRWLRALADAEQQTGRATNRGWFAREGGRLLHVRGGGLDALIVTALAYAAVEGVEAVGLWRERRWAEYLTALATAGLLPFEIYELVRRVSGLRVVALIVNLAVLAYLVVAKRLFGLGRGAPAPSEPDRAEIFAVPGRLPAGPPG